MSTRKRTPKRTTKQQSKPRVPYCLILHQDCPPHPDTGRRCKPGTCDIERLSKTAAKAAPAPNPERVTIAIEISEIPRPRQPTTKPEYG